MSTVEVPVNLGLGSSKAMTLGSIRQLTTVSPSTRTTQSAAVANADEVASTTPPDH